MLEICLRSNFAGTESFRLYSETFVGTKGLVQEWVDEGMDRSQCLNSSDQLADLLQTQWQSASLSFDKPPII